MAQIVTVEQMRAIETEADRKGVTFDRMMDAAGKAVFDLAADQFDSVSGKKVVVLCGGGNNGGDGLVAAAHFARAGSAVCGILAVARKANDPRQRAAVEAGCSVVDGLTETGRRRMESALAEAEILVDAVLGTGMRLPLRPPIALFLEGVLKCLSRMERRPFVVAVDCPSGVDCTSGETATQTIPADLTITLGAAKTGLIAFPAAESVGRLIVADIGLPAELESLRQQGPLLADPAMVRDWLPARPRNSHKGSFGRVIVIGGSVNYPGAPALAGLGAYRIGAGLVTLAVPAPVYPADIPILPEATWIVLPDEDGVIAAGGVEALGIGLSQAQVLVVGPGIGREKPTAAFLKQLLRQERGSKHPIGFGVGEKKDKQHAPHLPPLVVDADALRLLAQWPDWSARLPHGSILTPHPGEMSEMTGWSTEAIQKDRTGTAEHFAREWNAVVVLKGAFTVVASPEGRCVIEPFATPALAHAGTGDVLAGTVGGLVAQGVEGWHAAVLGAYLHGRAGEFAAAHAGTSDSVLARDAALFLSQSIAELRGAG
jgi:hydroxyethylthiazole kinase-like uncharacterized protein yjeF